MSNEPPPTRESIAYDMSEILRREHDIHGTKQITFDSLNNALISMTKFYLTPTNADEKIPFQYQKANQELFEINQVIISSALDKVDAVLTEMKTSMYQLEKNQHTMIMPDTSTPVPVTVPTPENQEKKSVFPSLRKPKPIHLNPNDPYQSSIELQKKILKLIDDWNLVVEWQSEGVEFYEDFDRISYDNYLSTHIVMFRKEIEPNLLRVYSQGLNIILMKEKELALQLGINTMKEIHQTRNDMNF